jgi:hypothetical protein
MFQSAAYFNNWYLWTLYHKVTFDGANRIITVNPEVTDLEIKSEVYSAWKEWAGSTPDNATWAPAIRSIGGDPTINTQKAGDIYFLQNNWKLYLDITKVKITGALFSDNFSTAYHGLNGTPIFPAEVASLVTTQEVASQVGQSGGSTAAEVWQYPTRTLTTASGPTASEIADAVWNELAADHNTDGTFGRKVLELWRLAGLDVSNVASITDTSITVGGVTISIGQPDSNTTTLTRS